MSNRELPGSSGGYLDSSLSTCDKCGKGFTEDEGVWHFYEQWPSPGKKWKKVKVYKLLHNTCYEAENKELLK